MGRKRRRRHASPSPTSSESNSVIQQKKNSEAGVGLLGSRNKVRVVLVAGGLLAAAGVGIYLNKGEKEEGGVDKKEEITWVQPDPVQPRDIEKFDPRRYQAPKAGRIWKTHFNDDSDRTIVYVADIHNLKDKPRNWPIQSQIFAIVEDGIQKYGQVPVVVEDWTDFGDPKYTYQRNIKGSYLTDLASESDIAKRKKAALELMENGKNGAGSLLAAVYQDVVIPIPSHTLAELKKDLQGSMVATFLMKAGKGNVPCGAVGVPEAKMSIATAVRSRSPETNTPERIACMCTYIAIFRKSVTDFSLSREERAAAEEVKRGAEYESPFVYIIAGTRHVSGAMKAMEKRGLNYIVVAPQSNDMSNIGKKKSRKSLPKLCDQWVTEHQEELRKSTKAVEVMFSREVEQMVNGDQQ
jgi:hypothetical protein